MFIVSDPNFNLILFQKYFLHIKNVSILNIFGPAKWKCVFIIKHLQFFEFLPLLIIIWDSDRENGHFFHSPYCGRECGLAWIRTRVLSVPPCPRANIFLSVSPVLFQQIRGAVLFPTNQFTNNSAPLYNKNSKLRKNKSCQS